VYLLRYISLTLMPIPKSKYTKKNRQKVNIKDLDKANCAIAKSRKTTQARGSKPNIPFRGSGCLNPIRCAPAQRDGLHKGSCATLLQMLAEERCSFIKLTN